MPPLPSAHLAKAAARGRPYQPNDLESDTADDQDHPQNNNISARASSSPSRQSFSSSYSQNTPARSFFHRSVQGSHAPIDVAHSASQDVRDDTAQLASWASQDVMFPPNTRSIAHQHSQGAPRNNRSNSDLSGSYLDQNMISRQRSNSTQVPDIIEEVSEPPSPDTIDSSSKCPRSSILSERLRNSAASEQDDKDSEDGASFDSKGLQLAIVGQGIISQPNESTALLLKKTACRSEEFRGFGSCKDLESQKSSRASPVVNYQRCIAQIRESSARFGMILFPLGEPLFADLGPDGISMFYISCIVSQLVYSCGGSIFRGGIGSEMIEVVPFFHKMAFTILARVGEENPQAVLATTVVSYSLSSILTGIVFYTMGVFHIGALIGFFPRHILIGCIGGVGWFLVATGLEVSARLDGNLEYNLATLHKLGQADTVFLWLIPLSLAIVLFTMKHWVKHPLTDATFFILIIAVFYFFVAAIDSLNLPELRDQGWVFESVKAGVPFYHFYSLYDVGAVDWKAVGATVPAMLALTFFGILHVPINIPALGLTTGEDNVDLDRELRAHGYSNALSGFCGSIQNYLVYTNSVLFIRSGGNSRIAGIMLAAATFAILVVGPVIIGYIPIMVVGALIFFLGFDLLREALVDTWGKVHRLEYLTVSRLICDCGARR
ncbi:MAG: hypothetical protein Q9195_003867 [Heterodermia aff. obscurata]